MQDSRSVCRVLTLALLVVGCQGRGSILEEPAIGPPGVQAMSRLNRVEHENSLDDLLGIASQASLELPRDPAAEGYDTVAKGLVLTPAYATHYERVTDTALDRFFGESGSRSEDFDRIVTCDPADGPPCVEAIARDFLLLAWRRPPSDEDVDWVVDLFEAGLALDSTPEGALKLAMKGVLMSPEFLFRVEQAPAEGDTAPLDAYEVASRLAYFLWSSTPDRELLAAAASGALLEAGGVAREAERMLADPRADALLENFAGQWFDIRAVMDVQPNQEVHAFFDDYLKRSMQLEMQSMAEPFVRGGERFDVVLTRTEARIERRLATHYRMLHQPGAGGLVSIAGTGRQGLLTTAGWLSQTSHPDETSAVRRGHWILQKLLCSPPPPPPPDLDASVDFTPFGSVRQQEEAVRMSGDCATCHTLMDPLGYALHGYDAVGIERLDDRLGFAIDAAVELDGTPVQGV